MEKKTLYCDICGKEIERTDNVQMSVKIERKPLYGTNLEVGMFLSVI